MENIFPFHLLKEGKLQVFPNGVIEPNTSNHDMPIDITDDPHTPTPSSEGEFPHEASPATETPSPLSSPALEDA